MQQIYEGAYEHCCFVGFEEKENAGKISNTYTPLSTEMYFTVESFVGGQPWMFSVHKSSFMAQSNGSICDRSQHVERS